MTDRKAEIKAANRAALPKFILITLLSCAVGGVLGFSMARFGVSQLTLWLRGAGAFFAVNLAPWLLVACVAAAWAVCLPKYLRAKAMLGQWDGEDEGVWDAADRRLSSALYTSNLLLVAGFFLLTASYSTGMDPSACLFGGRAVFFVALVGFIALMVSILLLQQKLVDLTRQLNPEKKGSVYDRHFQQKWLDSCDEAERAIIGQCAYKAYKATTAVCSGLWCVFTITALFLDTGMLPPLAVCIIWGTASSVYARWSRKLSRAGALSL